MDQKVIMKEALKTSNMWRTHNITTKAGEASPSLENLGEMSAEALKNNMKMVRVYWTTDGECCFNL